MVSSEAVSVTAAVFAIWSVPGAVTSLLVDISAFATEDGATVVVGPRTSISVKVSAFGLRVVSSLRDSVVVLSSLAGGPGVVAVVPSEGAGCSVVVSLP